MPHKSKKKSGVFKSKKSTSDGKSPDDKKFKDTFVESISESSNTKCSSISDERTIKMKSVTDTENERHKLVIDKPWFSPSISEINSLSSIGSPMSASIVSKEFIPDAVPSIPYSSSISLFI